MDPLAILSDAAAAWDQVDSYHFDMSAVVTATQGGRDTEFTVNYMGDFQAPDRAQGESSVGIAGLALTSEFVQIGSTIYITDPITGQWMMGEPGATPFDSPADIFPFDIDAASDADVQFEGQEEYEGVQTYHLSGSIPPEAVSAGAPALRRSGDGPFAGSTSPGAVSAGASASGDGGEPWQVDVWIGVEDSLPRGVMITGETSFEGDTPGTFQQVPMTSTTKFSNFGVDVDIEAPSVAMTGPSGASAHCPAYLEMTASGGDDSATALVASYTCPDSSMNGTGVGIDTAPTLSYEAGETLTLSFSAGVAPSEVEMRLYNAEDVTGAVSTWPEDDGGATTIESLSMGGAEVSHSFFWGPGEYALVARASWQEFVEAFYVLNLRFE